ncbi:uracil-DNA glycosylase family protein [Lacibacter luteus]|uniref:Uracil-DNA glycosylase family protein n=1 Tax=Lacibacter luteus TaxID=2508719 RepID=A0A4Q1CJ05_9BACT|nr:uracil-DNA glycosylase family protein [Lacibacter luteus]RXK60569.1 uracil-DNA glycosylase family protein [Lacibacter luteus]
MIQLLRNIHNCTVCKKHLPFAAKPILQFSAKSRIIIIGQAPGIKAHNSGIPWNDASGERLRNWLGVDAAAFYDDKQFALMPIGFCYPGKGSSGDNPPRPECAPQWHELLLKNAKQVQLKLLIGKYAQDYYLGDKQKATLTETVKAFAEYLPHTIVLPHPSPRNNIWLKKNAWFEKELLPVLKEEVQHALQ